MADICSMYVDYLKRKDSAASTINTYRPKVQKFVRGSGKYTEISQIFEEGNLRKFIFPKVVKKKHSSLNWWSALDNFFLFLRDEMKLIDSKMEFPINRDEAKKVKEHANVASSKGGDKVIFLPRSFDIQKLLDESLYIEDDGLVAQAIIALTLSTGYLFSHIEELKLYEYYDDEVPNKYFDGNLMMVKRIKLSGKVADILRKYSEYRNRLGENGITTDKFFIKNNKGSSFAKFIRTFLTESLSPALKLESNITIDDLRYNMALHSLYQSHGASLSDLIRIFGWKPFLQKVVEHYYRFIEREIAVGFDPFISENNNSQDGSEEEVFNDTIRMEILLHRVVRDTKEAVRLKKEYNYQCQICETWNEIGIENFYAEAHHIHQLGEHDGPDNRANMIVLCPSHHVLFDYGVIAIDPEDGVTLFHADASNQLNGKKLRLLKHLIGRQYIQYHWNNIFLGRKISTI